MRVLNKGGPFVMSNGQEVARGETVEVTRDVFSLLPRAFVLADPPDADPSDREE